MPDVVEICRDLIRFDTSNYGQGRSAGETECARYVFGLLRDAGYSPVLLESAPGRGNVVVEVAGSDPSLGTVLAHAHLDVVPAEAADWAEDPFAGRIDGEFLYGRGAVDMKDFAAALVSLLLGWAEEGFRPERGLLVAFVADEEDKGEYGADWLAKNHRELFRDVTFAISEGGGQQVPWTGALPASRGARPINFYPVAVAERGTAHLRLTAKGVAGHGSRINPDNAVVHLVRALAAIADHDWPITLTGGPAAFLDHVSQVLELPLDVSTEGAAAETLRALGPLAPALEKTLRVSTTPTVLEAGYKVNVIPETATAQVDVRLLPGTEESTLAVIDEILGEHVTREFISYEPPIQSSPDSEEYRLLEATLRAVDPDAVAVPICTGGGTDAKAFTRIGIPCYGFAPSCASESGASGEGAHGINERVPLKSLHFAVAALRALFAPRARGGRDLE